jgi:hypothetical protein
MQRIEGKSKQEVHELVPELVQLEKFFWVHLKWLFSKGPSSRHVAGTCRADNQVVFEPGVGAVAKELLQTWSSVVMTSEKSHSKFLPTEKDKLLKINGIGETVISRLESLGISSLALLREYDAKEITLRISEETGATCWRNSPQARKAIESAIALALDCM